MDRLVVMLSILVPVFLMSVASGDVTQPAGQDYWKKVLPNTPMPRVIKNLLTRAGGNVCKDCVTINNINILRYYPGQSGTEMQKDSMTHYDAKTVAFLFLKKDLQTGTKMTLHFTDPSVSSAAFISRSEASSLPFTSSKLPDILNHFSIEPHSNDAESMRQTLADCERAALEGEKKYCATSLESIVDFITMALGSRHVVALSTSVDKENSPEQRYKITSFQVQKKMSGNSTMVCHALSYAYAVFYCHTTKDAETYHVSLVGKDGTNVEAVAICHTDTSRWDPAYIGFKVLNVKPGTAPICHFLPQNHVVWAPK